MNARRCKALRAAIGPLLSKDWRERQYQGKWVASHRYQRTVSVPVLNAPLGPNGEQTFEERILREALQIRLSPTCGRAAYREGKKHVYARAA